MEARSENFELVRTRNHRLHRQRKRCVICGQVRTNMAMKIGTQMPRLEGATEWFGGTQAHAESVIAGHPTLVHFWSVSCGICKDNLPRVGQWRDEKHDQGLRVVAIHMPRYESDTD